jgi:anaerobic magnesium-protoporphyrin IX monomethyl ester cyclase
MHGPKIEMRRKKGEEIAAAALAAIERAGAEPPSPELAMACGGGKDQMDEATAGRY